MFKWVFRFAAVIALLAGLAIFLLSYQIIQTESGLHIVQKDEWGFDKAWVDTRDWGAMDYIKNTDITQKLAKIEWDKFGDRARDRWQQLQKKIDKAFESDDQTDLSSRAREKLADLRQAAEKKYQQLEKQFQNGDFSWEAFQKKLAELETWLNQQIEAVRAKFK